mmetsp:Transcript_9904/g.15872  ORF Transcript_9904/g.15872 Transcript_9904/m.15872 type:complete len:287 (-) Transcript_9904:152-1012(-)
MSLERDEEPPSLFKNRTHTIIKFQVGSSAAGTFRLEGERKAKQPSCSAPSHFSSSSPVACGSMPATISSTTAGSTALAPSSAASSTTWPLGAAASAPGSSSSSTTWPLAAPSSVGASSSSSTTGPLAPAAFASPSSAAAVASPTACCSPSPDASSDRTAWTCCWVSYPPHNQLNQPFLGSGPALTLLSIANGDERVDEFSVCELGLSETPEKRVLGEGNSPMSASSSRARLAFSSCSLLACSALWDSSSCFRKSFTIACLFAAPSLTVSNICRWTANFFLPRRPGK